MTLTTSSSTASFISILATTGSADWPKTGTVNEPKTAAAAAMVAEQMREFTAKILIVVTLLAKCRHSLAVARG
jgi:hypothetical protein